MGGLPFPAPSIDGWHVDVRSGLCFLSCFSSTVLSRFGGGDGAVEWMLHFFFLLFFLEGGFGLVY